jgi:hypothetical protein
MTGRLGDEILSRQNAGANNNTRVDGALDVFCRATNIPNQREAIHQHAFRPRSCHRANEEWTHVNPIVTGDRSKNADVRVHVVETWHQRAPAAVDHRRVVACLDLAFGNFFDEIAFDQNTHAFLERVALTVEDIHVGK